jgi:acid stress-induced BolA-like protein IbaG/YrbA
MEVDDVKNLILQEVSDAEIHVEGEGCNFSVDVISESFTGIGKLNRQKQVLSCIKEQLATGEIHAMSVKAFTPEEWKALTLVNIQ